MLVGLSNWLETHLYPSMRKAEWVIVQGQLQKGFGDGIARWQSLPVMPKALSSILSTTLARCGGAHLNLSTWKVEAEDPGTSQRMGKWSSHVHVQGREMRLGKTSA